MDRDVDLKKKTLQDLKYIAKMMGIKGVSTARKAELIEIILKHSQEEKPQEEKPVIDITEDASKGKNKSKAKEEKPKRGKKTVTKKKEEDKLEEGTQETGLKKMKTRAEKVKKR